MRGPSQPATQPSKTHRAATHKHTTLHPYHPPPNGGGTHPDDSTLRGAVNQRFDGRASFSRHHPHSCIPYRTFARACRSETVLGATSGCTHCARSEPCHAPCSNSGHPYCSLLCHLALQEQRVGAWQLVFRYVVVPWGGTGSAIRFQAELPQGASVLETQLLSPFKVNSPSCNSPQSQYIRVGDGEGSCEPLSKAQPQCAFRWVVVSLRGLG